MTNKPMLSVERELLSNLSCAIAANDMHACVSIGKELRALLDADKVNNREMGLMQYVEAHPIKPAAQHHGNPVAQSEFECDAICKEADGCPTEGAVLKRFWRENQPDTGLCEFYEAVDYQSLVKELVGHVSQLQEAAKRNVKPWEDTFPPTLLPAYIARINAEQPAPVALDYDAAAKKLAECMDYPWDHMPEQGRQSMLAHAKTVVDTARLSGAKP